MKKALILFVSLMIATTAFCETTKDEYLRLRFYKIESTTYGNVMLDLNEVAATIMDVKGLQMRTIGANTSNENWCYIVLKNGYQIRRHGSDCNGFLESYYNFLKLHPEFLSK